MPKSKPKSHKSSKLQLLHKYKILRKPEIKNYSFADRPEFLFAIDRSSLSRTIQAYLEVHFSKKNFYKAGKETQPSKIDLLIDSENVDVESYCNCNQPYSQGELMFKCEGFCGNWYHPLCLKMKVEEIERQRVLGC